MNRDLVACAAAGCPGVQFVMFGPMVRIDPGRLPRALNLHWLGPKAYSNLPAYLGSWGSGWKPFALHESTRFISLTKMPECLAAGLLPVSTAAADVVRGCGTRGLVVIAGAGNVAEQLPASLTLPDPGWRKCLEAHLAETSWDGAWAELARHLDRVAAERVVLEQRGP